ncbi:hypothetical protein [Telluribacter sp. SYSU D00476]|uniref:hypothetical protein n=1 Tax=Telluribacter sp. SYSU D00476 TaxID=2811430 RepID=UPI001FF3CEFD|nr:hypothetical protein [Telluribacter sp. SYSU D00476]
MLHTLLPAIVLLLSIFATTAAIAQDQPRNNLYLEVGGNGLFSSVNYERQLTATPGLQVRVGVGIYIERGFYLTVPVGINYLFPLRDKRSFIDAGLGATWAFAEGRLFTNNKALTDERIFNFVPSVGYRRHAAKNLMWKISVTPIINDSAFTPWAGISLGKRFLASIVLYNFHPWHCFELCHGYFHKYFRAFPYLSRH